MARQQLTPALMLLLAVLVAPSQGWECLNPGPRCSIDEDTGLVTLSVLDKVPGIVQSDPVTYWHGTFSTQMKVPSGYSGGTIFAFYLIDTKTKSNRDPGHTEIDVEIYGGPDATNLVLSTNVWAGGKQNLDQLRFPVDGSSAFHILTMQWSASLIVFSLNGAPMRILLREVDQPWPDQPMALRLSIWDSSSFTTLKADYSSGPVTVEAREIRVDGCRADPDTVPAAPESCPTWTDERFSWNRMPSTGGVALNTQLRKQYLIMSYGWETLKT